MASVSNSGHPFVHTAHNQTPSPSSTPPSSPIQLSGFLHGNTLQVQGDTDDFQFSVQVNVHTKHNQETPATTTPEKQTPFGCTSSIVTHEENVNVNANANTTLFDHGSDPVPMEIPSTSSGVAMVTTRLRSGVLSPVNYYPQNGENLQSTRVRGSGVGDVLQRVLKRHSLPIKPCSSYSFFVMVNWGLIRSSSFGEKSKILGQMWTNLAQNQKKVFERMALKDHARYKRQCLLLMGRGRKKV